MNHSNGCNSKRVRGHIDSSRVSLSSSKKSRNSPSNCSKQKISAAWIDLILLGNGNGNGNGNDDGHGFASTSGYQSFSSVIEPDRAYTIGRSNRYAQFVFEDPRVSKQHCQILFDSSIRKLYLLNGALLFSHCCSSNTSCIVEQFRDRLIVNRKERENEITCCDCTCEFKASLNGVFVNGVRVGEGLAVELCAGDEVMLVCVGNGRGVCGAGSRIGFIVRRIVFQEEVVIPGVACGEFRFERSRFVMPFLSGKVNKRVFALRVSDSETPSSECDEVVGRAMSLSAHCKRILHSSDPVSCILQSLASNFRIGESLTCISKEAEFPGFERSRAVQFQGRCEAQTNVSVPRVQTHPYINVDAVKGIDVSDIVASREEVVPSQLKGDQLFPKECAGAAKYSINDETTAKALAMSDMGRRNPSQSEAVGQNECWKKVIPPPVKNFYLNRLESMHQGSLSQQNVVSLPELLYPVNSIARIFIATFTSDIRWFLSYCDIPSHLPVTVACHSTERCWSGDPQKRSCVPYPDFPNLVAVYPPFPEAIAFGKDRKKQGVACHHPKLLVLQREDNLRVIITSANLVAKQWNNVTNTIWWQDFLCRNSPDWASLFNQIQNGCPNSDIKSDFAAQLAGFMATLLTDVPSQAYWISELTKYDFSGANAYLVASVPGIHSYRSISATIPNYMSKCSGRFFGSVEASIVGLSHLFRTAADSNGVQLKRLATYLGESSEKGCGMSEIMLRRDKNISADPNAVSVLVPSPLDFSKADCVQLGFLPRTVAKWVSPLWDAGIFKFFGYVCPREALAAAFGENNRKVRLILHVSQGPNFQDIPKMLGPEHHVAFCSLIASVRRCTGVWRLEEVLHQYKWPEHLESDFIYGSSSIGTSVGAQFLATFSSAAGKRFQQLFDSEESDPEWGCWNVSHELKHPSIRILFPTIDRVKSARCGIFPSKHILCFSEKAWQRLKPVDILHDAIPHPCDRVGYPMHVKVARRRFQSKADASSFGWLYCGSHNMSAAAWGRQISGTDQGCSSGSRLHVCNYELGIIFVFPPPETEGSRRTPNKLSGLDDIQLPFVVPAPKYSATDRPATMPAMREAMVELAEREGETVLAKPLASATEEMVEMEEVANNDDEEEDENVVQAVKHVAQEAEEETAYADVLWNHVDSSQSC